MRRLPNHRAKPLHAIVLVMLYAMALGGCVSTETHTKALTELEAAKKTSAQQAADLDALKKKSQAQTDQLQQQLAGLQQNLDQEAAQRKAAEQQAASLVKEREALMARSSELQANLDGLEKEKGQLGNELGNVRGQITALQQKLMDESAQVSALEKDKLQLTSGTTAAQGEITKLQKRAAELENDAARIAKEHDLLQQQQSQLTASLEQERQRLKAGEADKARLEQERLAKEEEIARLTRTQEDLSKSLQDEIAKGNITIQQVRDRLTINMVDRVLFDSGQAQVKPAGIKVLKQVADVLKTVTDKQIRIEGHTDNVPISSKLQDRFKTNWELSTARATTVVRYLIDQGTVDRQYLSAVGYADTHPIAANDSEEGRSSNRRIEIVLYPKDLKQIASQVEPSMPASR
ncbi:MAG: OmpA family protein [Nitrospirota bacterium]|nr:OmpA family protein [Nitrospirota bacterium]